MALAKALSRMATAGELCKVSKGKYYKPKETVLGKIKPANSEIVKDFLEKDGKMIGAILEYIGASAAAVRKSLNGVTSYKLPISEAILPNKSNWRIYEPAR